MYIILYTYVVRRAGRTQANGLRLINSVNYLYNKIIKLNGVYFFLR